MNRKKYEQLMQGVNNEIFRLDSNLSDNDVEKLNITSSMDLTKVEKQKLPLVHTMLHMFYAKKTGKGLTDKTIENLHKDVVKLLSTHSKFDKLDERG